MHHLENDITFTAITFKNSGAGSKQANPIDIPRGEVPVRKPCAAAKGANLIDIPRGQVPEPTALVSHHLPLL